MKESGINYFYNQLGLNTGVFGVFYTFEEGAGTQLNSVSGGQSIYSGALSSSASFWDSPGSGFFSGNYAQISNVSGLASSTWTQIYVYEKINTDPVTLFSSRAGTSGYSIGITSSNKPYLECFNQEPIVVASSNNLSSKNAIAFTYQPNFLTLGYYNFNSKSMEIETFNAPFELSQSDDWKLGKQYTGYMDYYMYLSTALDQNVVGQLLSGLFAIPTGIGYLTQQICSTGVTGYQNILVITTGVTGYNINPGGDIGQGFYTGAFPTFHTQNTLTGILSSGLYLSGLSGVNCITVTGSSTTLFNILSGYAGSFGMQKIQLYNYVESTDIIKDGYSYIPFYDIYNRKPLPQYSGYLIDISYTTGLMDLFYNGVAQANSGWSISGLYLTISGSATTDIATLDLKSGNKQVFDVTGGLTGFPFNYSGQNIYLNGVDLISGRDFILNAGTLNLTSFQTGISGYVFEYPTVLTYSTGSYSERIVPSFWRNTSAIYFNGIRQIKNSDYIEGATFDLFSGNSYNPINTSIMYNNTDQYWE